MDKRAWQATVHRVKELDTTMRLTLSLSGSLEGVRVVVGLMGLGIQAPIVLLSHV